MAENWEVKNEVEHKSSKKLGYIVKIDGDMLTVKWYNKGKGHSIIHKNRVRRTGIWQNQAAVWKRDK